MLLADFIENWCIGMNNDGLLIGIEFDQQMFGYESEPFDLILDLVAELKAQGKDLSFNNFAGVADLGAQVAAAK